ncbi:MAG: IspD/TarI family cytidylyltransferase, partial [Atopobiaceae bacterium]|nr:IspD/TarI family cytidylyltransferase [Atopobiaceae bacterium]
MRIHAVIIAAGSGSRMGQDIPKQFLNVNDKPVLLYTLEGFQNHPDIDEITLVCLDGWQNVVDAYARQFGIEKLVRIVAGGASGQESIRNGVFALEGVADPDDLVVIHDGIRPLVDDHVLSDVVRVAREKGNAVTSLPYNEQIFVVSEDDPSTTSRYIPRETLRRVSTPQAYRFGELDAAYHEAFERGVGIDGSHYTNTMMVVLGHT